LRVLRRVFSPTFYPWLFGLLQLGWVIEFHRLWPWWIPAAGAVALAGFYAVLVRTRERWLLKTALLGLVIGFLTIGPTISAIVTRERIGITSLDEDSAIQTELAVDRFLHGSAIYGSDWSHTVIAKMPWITSLTPTNPALHHFVYFPLTFLIAAPGHLLAGAFGLTFDYRMILILFVLLGLCGVWLLPISPANRFAVAIALYLNPLVTLYLWFGRNDVCFAGLIILGLALLARGRPVLASLSIGVATALKLFAAPAIPVLLVVLWLRFRRNRDRRELGLSLLAIAAVPLLTIVPFFLQAPAAFIRDVVLYPGGGLNDSYPIAGFGFGAILLLTGLVHHHDYFPFGLFQAGAMIAAGYFGLRAMVVRPTLGRWMLAYVGLFFGLSFFARYFNDSHLGVLAAFLLCCRPLGNQPVMEAGVEVATAVAA
jgi:hypothetical protein